MTRKNGYREGSMHFDFELVPEQGEKTVYLGFWPQTNSFHLRVSEGSESLAWPGMEIRHFY